MSKAQPRPQAPGWLVEGLAARLAEVERPLTIGSLCTGYGGLDMAAQAVLGGRLAFVADLDPGACKILAHRYPHVPNLGDLRAVAWEDLDPVDVLAAGFPCQPVSVAGKQRGTDDDRWLWDDIEHAVRRMARPPRALFLENVRGLLSANKGAAFARVTHGLSRLGYVGRYRVVHAADVGAPHGRPRVFLWAWRPSAADPDDEGTHGAGHAWRAAIRHAAGAGGFAADPGGEPGDVRGRAAPGEAPGGRAFCGSARCGGVPAGGAHADAGGVGQREGPGLREGGPGGVGGRRPGDEHGAAHADAEGVGRDQGVAESAGQPGRCDADGGGAPTAADAGRDGRQRGAQHDGGPDQSQTDDEHDGVDPDGCGDQSAGRRAAAADADGDAVRQQPVAEPGGVGAAEPGRGRAGRGRGASAADPAGEGPQGQGSEPERRGSESGDRRSAGRAAAADADERGRRGRPHPPRRQEAGRETADGDRPRCGCGVEWGPYTAAVRHWESVLGRPVPYPLMRGARGGEVLDPRLPEWMQGLPEGWVTEVPGLSRREQLVAIGNGVCPLQAAFALVTLLAP